MLFSWCLDVQSASDSPGRGHTPIAQENRVYLCVGDRCWRANIDLASREVSVHFVFNNGVLGAPRLKVVTNRCFITCRFYLILVSLLPSIL